ncbi:hypothetical protein BX286_0247 [Streptomyces sp. 3211.6]|uniref:hypothetical protein n=1 Tax=Streptomyces TaxID=1883 RepID=UPI000EB44820|nr:MULTISPECIES: hypothetical protein [Streptomyces]RKT02350.1 hypothetical protein BX286_0247 [Streptomyces sp. 3211.6]RPF43668.1 hypothetical protein EDD96_0173 [Streptomyces sp. Ag109_G2-6]
MPRTAPFAHRGKTYTLTRDQVEAAATSLEPADSARGLPYVWYTLVGSHLYYVVEVATAAAGQAFPDNPTQYVAEARTTLKALGYPILSWASPEQIEKGHPSHTC